MIRREPILDFHMCFLEILEILDLGTTARRPRPSGPPETKILHQLSRESRWSGVHRVTG